MPRDHDLQHISDLCRGRRDLRRSPKLRGNDDLHPDNLRSCGDMQWQRHMQLVRHLPRVADMRQSVHLQHRDLRRRGNLHRCHNMQTEHHL